MEALRILAVGDTGPSQEHPERMFESVKDLFVNADVRFGQVERTFSTRGKYQEYSFGFHSKVKPELASAYSYAGFDVVSLASNHICDWGSEPVVDSIERFNQLGIKTIGVGSNISEARAPAVFDLKGVKVGFLGYNSVLLPQYWATEHRPGCAPVRAYTYYRPYEYQPGAPPRVFSVPDSDDLQAMVRDIEELRSHVDFLVCSFHWGVHFVPRYIADYQIEVAHAAIDAGCDLILGHHAHMIKAVEYYRGKPCFYSLGNFALSSPIKKRGTPSFCAPEGKYTMSEVYDVSMGPEHFYSHKSFFDYTMVLLADVKSDRSVDYTILPAYVESGPQPIILDPHDSRFEMVMKLLVWSSEPFGTIFKVVDGSIKITS